MLQDNRDQQQASTSTVCKKSSSCSQYNSTFSSCSQVVSLLPLSKMKDDWILFYILLGTAVILGKKATQNMYADVSVHKHHRVELWSPDDINTTNHLYWWEYLMLMSDYTIGRWFKHWCIKICIPPSIVLPIQQVGFNCDISLPEGYKRTYGS